MLLPFASPDNEQELLSQIDEMVMFNDDDIDIIEECVSLCQYGHIDTRWGETSFTVGHYAAMFGSIEALKSLPLSVNTVIDGFISPLLVAVEHDRYDFIKHLLSVYDDEYETEASGWLTDIVDEYEEHSLIHAIRLQ